MDIRQVQKAWPSAEPLLRQAMSRFSQSASGLAQCFPQGVNTLRADRLSEKVIPQCEVADAVAKARAAESSGMKLLEPPGFSHGEVQNSGRRGLDRARAGDSVQIDPGDSAPAP